MMSNILKEPTSVSSSNGVLQTSIHLRLATVSIGGGGDNDGDDYSITTRTLNGTLPGPTLRVRPGDKLIVDFYNDLPVEQNLPYIHNEFSAPDESNLHFHGLHVSGELPSDDATLVVPAGQSYRYMTTIPSDHLPGTHWLHPHRHGSTALQLGGGAAAAIIVEDHDDDTSTAAAVVLPPQVREAREVLLVVQEMNFNELAEVAVESGDALLRLPTPPPIGLLGRDFYLVNGQVNPTIPLRAGEWIRLRLIHAGWLKSALDLRIAGCEMQLIAKDGVYVRDLPRAITQASLINAGRADIMVRCMQPGSTFAIMGTSSPSGNFRRGNDDRDGDDRRNDNDRDRDDNDWDNDRDRDRDDWRNDNQRNRDLQRFDSDDDDDEPAFNGPIATLQTVTDLAVESTAIAPLSQPIQYPAYLTDLRTTSATPGCSCRIEVNDLVYSSNPTDYVHTTFPGAIVERRLEARRHPYHQHVHPFQLVSGFQFGPTGYYQSGDYHDTILDEGTIRYMPTVFAGKLMMHCHTLTHEDRGMMGVEYIDATANTCQCGSVFDNDNRGESRLFAFGGGGESDYSPLQIFYMVLICVAVLLVMAALVWFVVRRRRRQNHSLQEEADTDGLPPATITTAGGPPKNNTSQADIENHSPTSK